MTVVWRNSLMLAHLPGRMSQPSRKGVTSNIFILRCSFHETAKRLSITSLMRLLRLHTKIQSFDECALQQIRCCSYTICDFATNKTEKNTKYHKPSKKNTELSRSLTNFRLHLNGDTKITDWITSQTPNCRRHPINLNNNIKDISQKKDLQKKRYRYNYLSLIFVIQTMKVEVAYSKKQHFSTLDASKTFWMTSKTVFNRPQYNKRKKKSFNKLIMSS